MITFIVQGTRLFSLSSLDFVILTGMKEHEDALPQVEYKRYMSKRYLSKHYLSSGLKKKLPPQSNRGGCVLGTIVLTFFWWKTNKTNCLFGFYFLLFFMRCIKVNRFTIFTWPRSILNLNRLVSLWMVVYIKCLQY